MFKKDAYDKRYLAGDYEGVVDELIAFGSAVVADLYLQLNGYKVAKEIMRRIKHNLVEIVSELTILGYRWELPPQYIIQPAPATMKQELDLLHTESGPHSIVLDAFYTYIGMVDFQGYLPLLDIILPQQPRFRPDPLVMIYDEFFIDRIEKDLSELRGAADEMWLFPDATSKIDQGGDVVTVEFPYYGFDQPLLDLSSLSSLSLISYLRRSLSYGGFAGLYEYEPLPPFLKIFVDRLTKNCVPF